MTQWWNQDLFYLLFDIPKNQSFVTSDFKSNPQQVHHRVMIRLNDDCPSSSSVVCLQILHDSEKVALCFMLYFPVNAGFNPRKGPQRP